MKKLKDQNTIKSKMNPAIATVVSFLWLMASLFLLGAFSCSKRKYQGNWYTIKQGDVY